MLVEKENIFQLIPQRPPMVMVDALLAHSAASSVSIFEIKGDNIFVSGGHFQMPGLVENIAQTAALRMGYEHMLRIQAAGGPAVAPPVGVIGEVKNLKINFLPPAGATLETTIDLLHTIFAASVVRGQVICSGQVAAECEMKIFAAG